MTIGSIGCTSCWPEFPFRACSQLELNTELEDTQRSCHAGLFRPKHWQSPARNGPTSRLELRNRDVNIAPGHALVADTTDPYFIASQRPHQDWIRFSLLGRMSVAGLTAGEIAEDLLDGLGQFFRNPRVNVELETSSG